MKTITGRVLSCALALGLALTVPTAALADTSGDASGSQTTDTSTQTSTSGAQDFSQLTPSLDCSTATTSSIKLSWKKVSGATSYKLYRKTDAGKYKRIRTLSASTRSYQNGKLSTKKTYSYRLRAFKGSTPSQYSKVIYKYKVLGKYKGARSFGGYLTSKQRQQLANAAALFVNKYQVRSMSKANRVLYAHDWICWKCSYTMKGNYFYTAYGCLVKKKASCVGYSQGMKVLCTELGIPCKMVRPNKKAPNPSHAWSIVKLKGKWYIVDVQGDDNSMVPYMFFLVGSKTYKNMTGTKWTTSKYPKVTSTDYQF